MNLPENLRLLIKSKNLDDVKLGVFMAVKEGIFKGCFSIEHGADTERHYHPIEVVSEKHNISVCIGGRYVNVRDDANYYRKRRGEIIID